MLLLSIGDFVYTFRVVLQDQSHQGRSQGGGKGGEKEMLNSKLDHELESNKSVSPSVIAWNKTYTTAATCS